jgi:hypothetical protein
LVRGNGNYGIAVPRNAITVANGANPWDRTRCPTKRHQGLAEGASLVVVYKNSTTDFSTAGATTLVYDTNLAGQEFYTSLSYGLSGVPAPSGSGPSIFTEIGADGQAGDGYDGSDTGKNTYLNSVAIAGPAANPSNGFDTDGDWDGTDGTPLNQLWDTHAHDVSSVVTGSTNTVSISSAGGDCLITVANVLTVR